MKRLRVQLLLDTLKQSSALNVLDGEYVNKEQVKQIIFSSNYEDAANPQRQLQISYSSSNQENKWIMFYGDTLDIEEAERLLNNWKYTPLAQTVNI